MTTGRRVARPQGQVRQGQLISTFGPGAMTDLPNSSVLVSGLDFWLGDRDVINEPRLSAKVANLLGVPTIQLETPPSVGDVDDHRPSGVPAFLFPEWFVTQDPPGKTREETRRSRYLVHSRSLERGNVFRHPETRDKLKVVPVRFVELVDAATLVTSIGMRFYMPVITHAAIKVGFYSWMREAPAGTWEKSGFGAHAGEQNEVWRRSQRTGLRGSALAMARGPGLGRACKSAAKR